MSSIKRNLEDYQLLANPDPKKAGENILFIETVLYYAMLRFVRYVYGIFDFYFFFFYVDR
jgi:hypothetical protein